LLAPGSSSTGFEPVYLTLNERKEVQSLLRINTFTGTTHFRYSVTALKGQGLSRGAEALPWKGTGFSRKTGTAKVSGLHP
jgi:hypothetical protein